MRNCWRTLRPSSRYFHGTINGLVFSSESDQWRSKHEILRRDVFQPLIRFDGVADDERRVSEGRLHAVESAVFYNWRSQSLDMRHILQLNGLNVSSELGVTVFVMDVSRMCNRSKSLGCPWPRRESIDRE